MNRWFKKIKKYQNSGRSEGSRVKVVFQASGIEGYSREGSEDTISLIPGDSLIAANTLAQKVGGRISVENDLIFCASFEVVLAL